MKNLRRKKELGLTLVELLMAVSISFIGFTAGYLLLQSGYNSLNIGTAVTKAQQEVRMAFETMIKELQETSADTIVLQETSADTVVIEGASDAISFASARDANNNFSTTESGVSDWRKAVVYAWDSESNTFYRYEEDKVDWTTNFDPEIAFYRYEAAKENWEANPNFDEDYPFDPNEPDLKLIATSVKALKFQLFPSNLLSVTIIFVKTPEGEGMEELTTAIRLQS
jgi:type II secretory pathway component PulJ